MTHLVRAIIRLWKLFLWSLAFLCRVLLVGWGTCAIWWSSLPWVWLRVVLAVLFVFFGLWCLWVSRRRGFRRFAVVFAIVVAGWLCIQPTHDRTWAPDVAVMPHAEVSGDKVVLHDVRNFEYRTGDEFTVHYEQREVQLSHLQALDLFVSYWGPVGPVAHTFVSFDFDNAPPVCCSIEARRRAGQGYEVLATCFKQYELIYVLGDERDLVRVRTNYRKENVFMFRVKMTPEDLRLLFLEYIQRVNSLYTQPEFYHLLQNNCTLNIHEHLKAVHGPAPWDWAKLLNGWTAELAYKRGGLDTSLPYDKLMEASLINDSAQAADQAADFSTRIRAGRPGF
jgi:hypothetical protein